MKVKIKYVMFDNWKPIIFGEYFNHSDVRSMRPFGKITSAGFVTPNGTPYGRSESLNMEPSEMDQAILERLMT